MLTENILSVLQSEVFQCTKPPYSRSPIAIPPSDASCWRWTIPTIVEDSDEGLSDVAVDTLTRCLKPVLDGLGVLDAEVLLELERCHSQQQGAILRDGLYVRPIHNEILPPCLDHRSVRYLHLSEVDGQYSMGIFVFPPHARIPLHDHPGMCVLSRVLYGDVHRLQLDLARDDTSDETTTTNSKSGPKSSKKKLKKDSRSNPADKYHLQQQQPSLSFNLVPPVAGAKRAYKRKVDHLQAPGTTMLYPYEGNLHEFVAGPNGAAILDVLLPPYDVQHGRDCTFYEIQDDPEYLSTHNNLPSTTTGDVIHKSVDDGCIPCWIIPTGQPEDFHCISGRFRDIGS